MVNKLSTNSTISTSKLKICSNNRKNYLFTILDSKQEITHKCKCLKNKKKLNKKNEHF